MPPGGAVPPGGAGRPPGRKGLVIGLAAGGTGLLLVVATVAVVLATRSGPAYASLPACDDLLPEEALAGIGDLEGTSVEESSDSGTDDGDVIETLGCSGEGGDMPGFVVWVELYDPATRDNDYRKLERAFEDQVEDLDDVLEDEEDGGSGSGSDSESDGYAPSPVGTQRISVGDDQRAYLMEESFTGEEMQYASAVFRMSNAMVGVSYYGDDEPLEEKGTLVVDLADQVGSSLKREAVTA